MDPLQVSMTGVRMGERFLQVGCDDGTLLKGLAAKVGLSGASAAVVFDEASAARARKAGTRAGALLDVQVVTPGAFGTASASVDMVVVDDTRGGFASLPEADRRAAMAEALRVVRSGGRIEVVEGLGSGGFLGASVNRSTGYDMQRALADAGFAPVRALAEKDGFRFIEGLKAVAR